jgi:hypothetical protein
MRIKTSSPPQITDANFSGTPSVHINSTFHRANDFPAIPRNWRRRHEPSEAAVDENLNHRVSRRIYSGLKAQTNPRKPLLFYYW